MGIAAMLPTAWLCQKSGVFAQEWISAGPIVVRGVSFQGEAQVRFPNHHH
jgi:hypothetical protein